MSELPEHVARNRAYWNDFAQEWVESGREDWATEEPRWGIFRVPESEVGVNSVFAMLCYPDEEAEPPGERLLRPYFGMQRFEWPEDESVEFHLPHGELIALLRKSGFEVEELIEIQPAENAESRFPHASLEWARRWPVEEAWRARKRA